jgi:hypothetical protein
MDRKSLSLLNSNFKAYIAPLLNEGDPEDYHVIWEFQKLFHAKRLEIMASESGSVKDWRGSSHDRWGSARTVRNAGHTSSLTTKKPASGPDARGSNRD